MPEWRIKNRGERGTCAICTPSSGVAATVAAAKATPAFRHNASATAPRAPPNTSIKMLAFWARSPPFRSSTWHLGIPNVRGSSLQIEAIWDCLILHVMNHLHAAGMKQCKMHQTSSFCSCQAQGESRAFSTKIRVCHLGQIGNRRAKQGIITAAFGSQPKLQQHIWKDRICTALSLAQVRHTCKTSTT